MTAASLEFQLAERQLWQFEHQSQVILPQAAGASENLQCERWLLAGIEAYKWLSRGEEAARLADVEGLVELTPAAESAILRLYQRWDAQHELAEPWIAKVLGQGHTLDNLAEYQECGSCVRDWLEQHEIYALGQQTLSEQSTED